MTELADREHLHESLAIDSSVSLRQLQPSEAGELFELTDTNRLYLGKWLPWVEHTHSPADSEQFITEIIQKRQEGSEFGFGIIVEGKPAGHASLMHVTDGKDPEIGYWISEEVAGQGITSKVAGALTDFGFDTLGLSRIVIKADPENIGSNKVAEKTGYTLEAAGQSDTTVGTVNIWAKMNPASV